jgi:hypothetical protein
MTTKTIIRVLFWGAVAVVFYLIATHIWWTGEGFCFNTADVCLIGGK